MDDDDMRRGQLSTHRAYSVPVATAAGAAMIPLAALAARWAGVSLRLPEDVCCTIVKVLMQGAGAGGMIGGQLLDLAAEGRTLSPSRLDAIHSAKTGALIAASVKLGAIAAEAGASQADAFGRYGERIGLAFQIMDDVLDVEGSSADLGKTAGKDAADDKPTFVSRFGVDGARGQAEACIDYAKEILGEAKLDGRLPEIAEWTISRKS